MKIDEKIISIPPYLSTTWENVASIRFEDGVLLVSLIEDRLVRIPDLSPSLIEQVFAAHIAFVEKEDQQNKQASKLEALALNHPEMGFPIRLGPSGFEGFGGMMQHNPMQAGMPEIPEDILKKVSSIANVLGLDENAQIPQAEDNCNCMYCQLARAIQEGLGVSQEIEEEVSEEDLRFREWDIEKTKENLYTVKNPLDAEEAYTVFLGTPVGCTCGKNDCEHIKAVLRS